MIYINVEYWRGYLIDGKVILESQIESVVKEAIDDWNLYAEYDSGIKESDVEPMIKFARQFHSANKGVIDKDVIQAYAAQCL